MSASTLADRVGSSMFRVGMVSLWAYACIVFPWRQVLGIAPSAVTLASSFLAGSALIVALSRRWGHRQFISPGRLLDAGVLGLLLLLMVLAGDFAVAVRDNWARRAPVDVASASSRARDRTVWHGELYPRMYAPTDKNFMLYKPNVRLAGETYGERYLASMLESPTLVKFVLERRPVSYAIGPEGLRELEPLGASRMFALGDSFAFGFATDEGLTWPDLLGQRLGEPVFNLGVSATSPRQQLQLLEYMLETHSAMRIERLLWMIFEGNDLENSYAERPPAGESDTGGLLDGTILEPVFAIPARVREQSLVRKLAAGELTIGGAARRYGQYEVDGVHLPVPLFRSRQFGYRLFTPADTDVATRPKSYVDGHPNRPLLDQTFRDMQALSSRVGFEVTVVLAPSDARVYGAAFEDFPELSAEPHFLNYVHGLSGQMGFSVIDLLPLLKPAAATEMLYYRDDHHWNARGNQVVADLVADALDQE